MHILHLSACLWDFLPPTTDTITEELVTQAIQADIDSRDQLYLQIWQTIGDPKDQLILRRLGQEKHLAVSSPDFCSPLAMNPATVTRRLRKITKRTRGAVIHLRSTGYLFSDPFFEEWVRRKT